MSKLLKLTHKKNLIISNLVWFNDINLLFFCIWSITACKPTVKLFILRRKLWGWIYLQMDIEYHYEMAQCLQMLIFWLQNVILYMLSLCNITEDKLWWTIFIWNYIHFSSRFRWETFVTNLFNPSQLLCFIYWTTAEKQHKMYVIRTWGRWHLPVWITYFLATIY